MIYCLFVFIVWKMTKVIWWTTVTRSFFMTLMDDCPCTDAHKCKFYYVCNFLKIFPPTLPPSDCWWFFFTPTACSGKKNVWKSSSSKHSSLCHLIVILICVIVNCRHFLWMNWSQIWYWAASLPFAMIHDSFPLTRFLESESRMEYHLKVCYMLWSEVGNVHDCGPDITMSSADCTLYTTSIRMHSFYSLIPFEENSAHFLQPRANHYNSDFIIPSGTQSLLGGQRQHEMRSLPDTYTHE